MPSEETASVSPVALVAGACFLIVAGCFTAAWMLHPQQGVYELADLAVYRAAGNAVTHGHSVYGSYVGEQLRYPLPFIYPPISAIVAVPFTWLSRSNSDIVWTIVTLAVLAAVVRVCFRPLIDRFGRAAPLAWLLTFGVVLALAPVEDHLRFGQVGIALMACCLFDCLSERPRWPRGVLVGFATAIKLVPGIFVPYLWFTGRKRAAWTAVGTFVGLNLVGAVISHSDTWTFFHKKIFEPTSPTWFANQSLEGILQRAFSGPWRALWLVAVVVVVVYGLKAAVAASNSGEELRGIALTALVGALVSPISWIHHLVWVIPALAVIIGDGRDRKRTLVAFGFAALFVARLPYVGHDELHGHGLFAALLQDSYGFLCIALLIYIARPLGVKRPAPVDQPQPA